MNVYAIEASGDYAGGMAIVAADSEEAARAVAAAALSSSFPWRVRYGDPNEVTLLAGVQAEGLPRVLTYYEMGE